MFDRKSAHWQSYLRRWLPESCPKLASNGDCVISGGLPAQQYGSLDTVCPAGGRKSDFWRRASGRSGPTESFENQDQAGQESCKTRERKPSPDHGSREVFSSLLVLHSGKVIKLEIV